MILKQTFNWWVGVIEDRNDPEKLGRVRVRIFGYHTDDRSLLPTDDLPWAIIMQPTTSSAISGIGSAPVGLVTGTWCVGFFLDGDDMQQPMVMGTLGGMPDPLPRSVSTNEEQTTNPPNVVRSTSGLPVLDSQGNPILSEPPTDVEGLSALAPLTEEQVLALMREIGRKESSSIPGGIQNYNAQNRLGYIGKYQFGAPALATLGYVRIGNNQKLSNDVLNDSNVWVAKNGLKSKQDFFASGRVQETIMAENLKFNYNILKRKGVISSNDDPARVAGLLSVSHLLGSGGAISFAAGKDNKDANGVSGKTYYDLGCLAVSGQVVVQNAPRSQVPSYSDPTQPLNNMSELQPRPFSDPNNEYPKPEYANYPDTNKLATGVSENTIIEKRRNSRLEDVPVVTGEPWDEPFPAFCSKYPYNQTFETESGHIVEFDNTPGQERVHVYHKAGTFIEIDVNGSMVRKVVGDNYEMVEHNNYLYTRGAYKLTVEGATQILVKNKADIQIYGETNATINNKLNLNVADDINVIAGGALNIKAKSFNIDTEEQFNAYTGGGIGLTAGGDFNVVATNTNVDGGLINLNSGTATSIESNGLGSAPDNLSFEETDVNPLQRPECNQDAFDLDAGEPGAEEIHQRQVQDGDVIEKEAKEGESAAPLQNQVPIADCDCNEFEGINFFSDVIQLSKYFNLGQLSSRAVVIKERVVAQRGLTTGQIVCNLKNLAVNCLDKIKEKYPDMIVTNAFRLDRPDRTNISDHGMGMAADLQFPSIQPSQYFEIINWIAANVQYKQLLLEYGGGARNPWIHIAFDKAGNKHPVPIGTFKDHKFYARNKFVNLA
jgi:hypothetical protein